MAEKKIELRVIAPTMATDKSPYKFRKRVDMVIMRAETGDIGILPGRMPLMATLDAGILRIFDESNEFKMAIMGGVASVADDTVTILSDAALLPADIDTEEVAAKIKTLRQRSDETSDFAEKSQLRLDIRRQQLQLDIGAQV